MVPVNEKVRRQAEAAVADLQAEHQYEGRQWIDSDYLSVKPAPDAPNNRIVTVRETWSDYLVTYPGDDPFAWYDSGKPEPVTARRGPYTVEVAYELQPWKEECKPVMIGEECFAWRVVGVEGLSERPAWETP